MIVESGMSHPSRVTLREKKKEKKTKEEGKKEKKTPASAATFPRETVARPKKP